MTKFYEVTYKITKIVEVDDNVMREFDYGPEITDEMRLEFLEGKLESEDLLDNCISLDKEKIIELESWRQE